MIKSLAFVLICGPLLFVSACGQNRSFPSPNAAAETPSAGVVGTTKLATSQESSLAGGQKYSASLLLVPAAEHSRYFKYPDGRQQLTYTTEADYPAEDVLSSVEEELKKAGWKPLAQGFLNPDMPSSVQHGWSFVEDHTQTPATGVYGWAADWENETHDITSYTLKYESPTNSTRNLRHLQVFATYMSAELATKMKSNLDKAMHDHKIGR